MVGICGLGASNLGQGLVVASFERGNKLSGSIKDMEFLE
jgi:hypothetical protein